NQQSYWTVVGISGGRHTGLLNEDGMLESDKGQFSVEPFLFVDGRLESWANASATQSLAHGYLPVPTVTWMAGNLSLDITTFADGSPASSALVARSRVRRPSAPRPSTRAASNPHSREGRFHRTPRPRTRPVGRRARSRSTSASRRAARAMSRSRFRFRATVFTNGERCTTSPT